MTLNDLLKVINDNDFEKISVELTQFNSDFTTYKEYYTYDEFINQDIIKNGEVSKISLISADEMLVSVDVNDFIRKENDE